VIDNNPFCAADQDLRRRIDEFLSVPGAASYVTVHSDLPVWAENRTMRLCGCFPVTRYRVCFQYPVDTKSEVSFASSHAQREAAALVYGNPEAAA
jgi:hypothetical protein